MLDLRAGDLAALADRGVGADVAVAEPRTRADHRGAADDRPFEDGPGLDDDAAVELGVDQLALDPLGRGCRGSGVGLQHVLETPGVLPPAPDDVGLHPRPESTSCWIASVISSSPRAEGSMLERASWIAAVNM